MDRRFVRISILFLTLSISMLLCAIRTEFQSITDMYNDGEQDLSRNALLKLSPANDEEKAFVLYYKAILSTDADITKSTLQQLISAFPKQQIVQKAYLELAHIYLLDREYDQALSTYRKITDPSLTEKTYWIAHTQNQMGQSLNAIASAELFIRSSNISDLIEDAYFLIADAYIYLDQYNNAVNALNKMLSKLTKIEDEQYLHYRLGYANEFLGNKSEALSHYKSGYEINRFSQLAYLIEDRLFLMRGKNINAIDLSFLYPFSEAPLPDIVQNTPANGTNTTDPNNPIPPVEEPKIQSRELSQAPDKGIFLQAGRFSNKVNAGKLSDKIASLGYACQYYQTSNYKDVSWVVICGPFETNQLATDARDELKTNSIDCFIIQR